MKKKTFDIQRIMQMFSVMTSIHIDAQGSRFQISGR